MNLERRDRIALAVALLLAMGSAAWFGGRALTKADRTPALAESVVTKLPEPTQEFAPSAGVPVWERPPSQSRGSNWVYEVFTPPEIERDAQSGRFSVREPAGLVRAGADEADPKEFGLALLAVARAPFRLQLVGHAGVPERCQGVFEDQFTGRILLAGAGQRVGELDYVIESMAVERQPLSFEHPRTVRPVAKAVIRDTRSGERVEVTDQTPALTDAAIATVSVVGGEPGTRVVQAGDEIALGEVLFRIGKIQLAPPLLQATKVSPRSPSPVTCVLLAPATEFAGLAQPTL